LKLLARDGDMRRRAPKVAGPRDRKPLNLRTNTLANIGGKGLSIAVSLFTSPFIITQIGVEAFGFWAIISAFSAYAALLNFGIGPAFMRYVAAHHALGEHDEIARKGTTSMLIAWVFAILIVSATIAATMLLPASWTDGWPDQWEIALVGVGVNLACVSIASAFQAYPAGLGRWDLQNLPTALFQIVFTISIIVTLLSGMGLGGLGVSVAVAGAAMVIAAWGVARYVWRQPWSLRQIRRAEATELLRYGGNLQLINLVVVINVQADKPVLLAAGGSLRFVAYYELASRVAFQLRSLPVMALGPLATQAAHDAAGQPLTVLRTFYERSLTLITSIGAGPLLAVFGACYPLMLAWLGPSYTTTSTIVVILGFGYAINLVTGAGSSIARGCGRPELDRNYSLLGLAINVGLTVACGAIWGPWGVIAATAAGLTFGSVYMLVSMDRWLGSQTFGRHSALLPALPSLGLGALTFTATIIAMQFVPTDVRWSCLVYGIASMSVFATLCLTFMPDMYDKVVARLRRRSRADEVAPAA
jgi:O-antigen/teichoic acid export membrane protein